MKRELKNYVSSVSNQHMLSVYNRWFIRYNLVFVLGRNILPASRREVRCLRIWNKKFKMYIILWGIKQIWCLQQLTIINKQYFCLIIDFSRVKSLPFGQFLELALPKSQFGCCFGLSVLFFFKLCIYLWLCQVFVAAQAVSSCSEWGCSSFQSEGFSFWQLLLLQSTGSECTGFRNCGARTGGVCNLPRPGIEPMSLALAGRFLSTVLPGKSWGPLLMCVCF